MIFSIYLFSSYHIQAYRETVWFIVAGVIKNPEGFNSRNLRETRLLQEIGQEEKIPPEKVIVVRVNLPTEHHAHDMELDGT